MLLQAERNSAPPDLQSRGCQTICVASLQQPVAKSLHRCPKTPAIIYFLTRKSLNLFRKSETQPKSRWRGSSLIRQRNSADSRAQSGPENLRQTAALLLADH
jgi:hypothetical protein